ncbi:MAG: hypothetical protein ACK559_01585, partial [bacterium]
TATCRPQNFTMPCKLVSTYKRSPPTMPASVALLFGGFGFSNPKRIPMAISTRQTSPTPTLTW